LAPQIEKKKKSEEFRCFGAKQEPANRLVNLASIPEASLFGIFFSLKTYGASHAILFLSKKPGNP
jgi:hypothetical protein